MKNLKWKECSQIQKRNRVIAVSIYLVIYLTILLSVAFYYIIPSVIVFSKVIENVNPDFIKHVTQGEVNLLFNFPLISSISTLFCLYFVCNRIYDLIAYFFRKLKLDLGEI